jgi:OOP family OmpA-OmpF porin
MQLTRVSATMAALGLIALLTTVRPVAAADNGLYLGAAFTNSQVDSVVEGFEDFEFDDTSFKLIAGLRPLDWLGFEANYVDLGSEQIADLSGIGIDLDAKAYSVFAVGYLQLDPAPLDLYAKVGLARWEVDGSVSSILGNFSASDDGTEFAYGVGVQARFGSLAVRAEYETFEIESEDKFELLSVGLTWTFL